MLDELTALSDFRDQYRDSIFLLFRRQSVHVVVVCDVVL